MRQASWTNEPDRRLAGNATELAEPKPKGIEGAAEAGRKQMHYSILISNLSN